MKLYTSPTSPYARKARIVVAEKKLGSRIEEITTDAWSDPAELIEVNPLGKVPALVADSSLSLFDSPLICAYLDALPSEVSTPLIPPSGPQYWTVRRAEALADGMMDLGVGLLLERRKPEGERSPKTAARWRGQLERALAAAQATAPTLPDGFTMGHASLAVALGYLDLRHADLAWRENRGPLAAWYEAVQKRPSFQATAPPPAA